MSGDCHSKTAGDTLGDAASGVRSHDAEQRASFCSHRYPLTLLLAALLLRLYLTSAPVVARCRWLL